MKNGDISNEVPPRLFVTFEVVSNPHEETKKVFGVINKKVDSFTWNLSNLQRVWKLSSKYGIIVEMVVFGVDQETADKYMEDLDKEGINPFNFALAFKDIDTLINQIPYRFNLHGVVDLPGRVARYGSWGLDIDNL